jgi:hypothetical protein
MSRFEILPGLRGTGPLPEQFSITGKGAHREDLVIKFVPESATSWVGNFQGGLTGFDAVLDHPNGIDVVVVARGHGYVIRPETKQVVENFGGMIDTVVKVPESKLLVFGCAVHFGCFGENGKRWKSRRISWDGMRNLRVDGIKLHGEAWSPLGGQKGGGIWEAFELDIRSGEFTGGSYRVPN